MSISSVGPAEFGLSPTTGFLPEREPLKKLPPPFEAWERLAQELPKFLMADDIRAHITSLPPFPLSELRVEQEWERAMVLLSYLGHAFMWSAEKPADKLPAVLAIPWHAVAKRLGRPPVLSYASYCLHNWKVLDPAKPFELGNIALIQEFLGGQDEQWFVLIHVEIERRAAPAMAVLIDIQDAVAREADAEVEAGLETVAAALARVNETMNRMPERCDPYIYFHRVRPYIHGWRNHPDIPNGLTYEGVHEYHGPQTFRGETGAQSGIVPALDALFRVAHAPDQLRTYLLEMREYMPPNHRAFVEKLESGPDLRSFVLRKGGQLADLYNQCVSEVEAFRSKHLEYAAKYIFHQAQTDPKNPSAVGTGGTPFIPYLKKHRDETSESLVRS